MQTYPILFSYRDPVIGRDYVAGVEMRGRALLTEEQDGTWWAEGVSPGGFANGGATRQEALSNFRTSYKLILEDIADDVPDFDQFREKVEAFFRGLSGVVVADFDAAVQRVRQEDVGVDWL